MPPLPSELYRYRPIYSATVRIDNSDGSGMALPSEVCPPLPSEIPRTDGSGLALLSELSIRTVAVQFGR